MEKVKTLELLSDLQVEFLLSLVYIREMGGWIYYLCLSTFGALSIHLSV